MVYSTVEARKKKMLKKSKSYVTKGNGIYNKITYHTEGKTISH